MTRVAPAALFADGADSASVWSDPGKLLLGYPSGLSKISPECKLPKPVQNSSNDGRKDFVERRKNLIYDPGRWITWLVDR